MKIGLIYGGQGSQVQGMGGDFYRRYPQVREVYHQLPKFALKSMGLSADELTITRNTQRALLAYQLALTNLIKDFPVDSYAGLSLGEYSAFFGSKILNRCQVWEIIDHRSRWMEEEGKKRSALMVALRNPSVPELKEICRRASTENKVEISNYNTKGQVVISGEASAVKKAVKLLEEQGATFTTLPVSGAFHTSYMEPVEEKLRALLAGIRFRKPEGIVYSNYLGRKVEEGDSLSEVLAMQVSHPVRFQEILEGMLQRGIDTFIEISPGEVLTKFVKKLNRKVKTYALTSPEAYEKCRKELL